MLKGIDLIDLSQPWEYFNVGTIYYSRSVEHLTVCVLGTNTFFLV